MLDSQRIQIDRIKLQRKINEIPEMRDDDPEAETRMAKRSVLMEQLLGIDEKFIEALQKEDQEAQAVMARHVDTDGWPSELRELRELAQKTSIVRYLRAAADQSEIREGPEAEYNKHILGNFAAGDYPLEMLLDRNEMVKLDAAALGFETKEEEERTLLTGVANNAGNISYADRLLADTDGAYLMATFPAVGPGRHSYPIITGTTVADDYARGATETPAGGLSIENADAERIQHSYQMSSVDDFHMPGVAAYLARDLRASLASGLDLKVVTDLLSELTQVADTATITLAKWFGKWGAVVDGRAAKTVNDVRWLVGTHGRGTPPVSTYSFASALSIANVGHFFTLIPHDRFRGTPHIPQAVVTTIRQDAIAVRTGAPGLRRLIVPVWRRASLLRDPYSGALDGDVYLIGSMYAQVVVVNSDQHARYQIDNS